MKNSLPIRTFGFIVALLFPLIAGCGKSSRPSLGTVHGRVTIDGKPLAHANVVSTSPVWFTLSVLAIELQSRLDLLR